MADWSKLQNIWQDPMFQFGVGMLAANRGPSGGEALQNALAGGMQGVTRGQTMVSNIDRQQAATELAQQQQQKRAMQLEQQRRLAAAAPQLAPALMSQDPEVRQQAIGGIAGMMPEALPGMLGQAMRQPSTQKPTSLMQNLASAGYVPGTPEYEQAMLNVLTKPATQISMGEKLPTNYRWVDPQDRMKGVEPIPGSPAEKETRKEEYKLGGVGSALDRYRNVLKKHGAEIMPGAAKSELQTAYFDLMMEMKELFNLGVLQGPDLEIMQQTLTNPVTTEGKWLEMTGGMEAFEGQLALVDQKLSEARARAKALTGKKGAPPLPPGFQRQ